MSSQRKIASSRANGAKSRGPTTPEGKARCAAVNVEHGILCRSVVLPDEESSEFLRLMTALEQEHKPQTETESAFVQCMAVARWRLVRIWCLERATLANQMAKYDPAADDAATRCALAFQTLGDESRTLDLLHRYETRYQRQHDRSLQLLQKMQQLRQNQNLPNVPIPETDTPGQPESTPPQPERKPINQYPNHPSAPSVPNPPAYPEAAACPPPLSAIERLDHDASSVPHPEARS